MVDEQKDEDIKDYKSIINLLKENLELWKQEQEGTNEGQAKEANEGQA